MIINIALFLFQFLKICNTCSIQCFTCEHRDEGMHSIYKDMGVVPCNTRTQMCTTQFCEQKIKISYVSNQHHNQIKVKFTRGCAKTVSTSNGVCTFKRNQLKVTNICKSYCEGELCNTFNNPTDKLLPTCNSCKIEYDKKEDYVIHSTCNSNKVSVVTCLGFCYTVLSVSKSGKINIITGCMNGFESNEMKGAYLVNEYISYSVCRADFYNNCNKVNKLYDNYNRFNSSSLISKLDYNKVIRFFKYMSVKICMSCISEEESDFMESNCLKGIEISPLDRVPCHSTCFSHVFLKNGKPVIVRGCLNGIGNAEYKNKVSNLPNIKNHIYDCSKTVNNECLTKCIARIGIMCNSAYFTYSELVTIVKPIKTYTKSYLDQSNNVKFMFSDLNQYLEIDLAKSNKEILYDNLEKKKKTDIFFKMNHKRNNNTKKYRSNSVKYNKYSDIPLAFPGFNNIDGISMRCVIGSCEQSDIRLDMIGNLEKHDINDLSTLPKELNLDDNHVEMKMKELGIKTELAKVLSVTEKSKAAVVSRKQDIEFKILLENDLLKEALKKLHQKSVTTHSQNIQSLNSDINKINNEIFTINENIRKYKEEIKEHIKKLDDEYKQSISESDISKIRIPRLENIISYIGKREYTDYLIRQKKALLNKEMNVDAYSYNNSEKKELIQKLKRDIQNEYSDLKFEIKQSKLIEKLHNEKNSITKKLKKNKKPKEEIELIKKLNIIENKITQISRTLGKEIKTELFTLKKMNQNYINHNHMMITKLYDDIQSKELTQPEIEIAARYIKSRNKMAIDAIVKRMNQIKLTSKLLKSSMSDKDNKVITVDVHRSQNGDDDNVKMNKDLNTPANSAKDVDQSVPTNSARNAKKQKSPFENKYEVDQSVPTNSAREVDQSVPTNSARNKDLNTPANSAKDVDQSVPTNSATSVKKQKSQERNQYESRSRIDRIDKLSSKEIINEIRELMDEKPIVTEKHRENLIKQIDIQEKENIKKLIDESMEIEVIESNIRGPSLNSIALNSQINVMNKNSRNQIQNIDAKIIHNNELILSLKNEAKDINQDLKQAKENYEDIYNKKNQNKLLKSEKKRIMKHTANEILKLRINGQKNTLYGRGKKWALKTQKSFKSMSKRKIGLLLSGAASLAALWGVTYLIYEEITTTLPPTLPPFETMHMTNTINIKPQINLTMSSTEKSIDQSSSTTSSYLDHRMSIEGIGFTEQNKYQQTEIVKETKTAQMKGTYSYEPVKDNTQINEKHANNNGGMIYLGLTIFIIVAAFGYVFYHLEYRTKNTSLKNSELDYSSFLVIPSSAASIDYKANQR